MAGLIGAALVLMLNSFAFDAAKWRMGETAVASGIRAQTVDAGMEWVGYHAAGVANIRAVARDDQMWYTAYWSSFRPCAVVSSSLLNSPGFSLVKTDWAAYRLLLLAGPQEPLFLFRVNTPGCG